MRRENYVCLEHRVASRLAPFFGSYHCPVDGGEMVRLGTKWRIPKKDDDDGWEGVAKYIADRRRYMEGYYSGPVGKMEAAERLLKRWRST